MERKRVVYHVPYIGRCFLFYGKDKLIIHLDKIDYNFVFLKIVAVFYKLGYKVFAKNKYTKGVIYGYHY